MTRCTLPILSVALLAGACGPKDMPPVDDAYELIASADRDRVRLEVEASDRTVETGETIELIVTLEAPAAEQARIVLPDDRKLGEFDIIRVENAERGLDDLLVADRRRITISTLASGDVVLPPLEARFGAGSSLATGETVFTIESLIDGEFDPTSFADIRPAVADMEDLESGSITNMLLVSGAACTVVLLAIAFALLARRRRRPRVPHEWALAELDRIESEGPPREDRTTDRFERIEGVLRWYVAFRFDIDAPDRTSSELLSAIDDGDVIDDDARILLERVVRQGDRAKFAGGSVTVEECEAALSHARSFVEGTSHDVEEEAA